MSGQNVQASTHSGVFVTAAGEGAGGRGRGRGRGGGGPGEGRDFVCTDNCQDLHTYVDT